MEKTQTLIKLRIKWACGLYVCMFVRLLDFLQFIVRTKVWGFGSFFTTNSTFRGNIDELIERKNHKRHTTRSH